MSIRLSEGLAREARNALQRRRAGKVSACFEYANVRYFAISEQENRPENGTYYGSVEAEGKTFSVYLLPETATC